jgi:hypothetical protein
MIGKMAADRAKNTANEIAMEASTHVVNELSKDLNEELAEHAKLEATTTKTDTIKTEKNVDEAAGTITKKEIKQSVKETVIQIGSGESTAASKIGGEAGTPESTKPAEDVEEGEKKAAVVAAPKSNDDKTPSIEAIKKEAVVDSGKKEGEGKHSSVVIKSTTKTTSIKIDVDGTITIGTDTPKEMESTKTDKVEVEADEKVNSANGAGAPTAVTPKSATDVSKSLENKINEAIEHVAGQVPVELITSGGNNSQKLIVVEEPITKIPSTNDSDMMKVVSPEPLTVSPARPSQTPIVPDVVSNGANVPEISALEDSLNRIHKRLDALDISNATTIRKATQQRTPTVDTHIHESLAHVHQKLDGMISSRTKENQDILTKNLEEAKTTSTNDTSEVLKGAVEKIHISKFVYFQPRV